MREADPCQDDRHETRRFSAVVWCDRRGVPFHLVSDGLGSELALSEFAERQAAFWAWCAERERFARRHGWTGGEDARRQEQVHAEPFDLSAI
jgi:hypothetical protein